MKKTWGIISEALNRNVPNSIPDTMTINDEDCRYRQVIADSFNDFFPLSENVTNNIFVNIMGRISMIT